MHRRTFIKGLTGGVVAGEAVGTVGARTTARQHQGGSGSGSGSGSGGGGSGGGGGTHTIGMHTEGTSYYFDPVGLYVEPGDTVKWTIESGGHSTTSYSEGNPSETAGDLIPKGAKSWNSGVIRSGSFTYTFDTKGTYDYYCIPHKTLGMVGRIVCGEPGGPAENTEIPDDVGGGIMPESDTIVKKKSLSYPYVPNTGHGGPPMLFWGGVGAFGLTSLYLFGIYDRKSGRYDELSEKELGTGRGRDGSREDD